jgi:hypothetical protein
MSGVSNYLETRVEVKLATPEGLAVYSRDELCSLLNIIPKSLQDNLFISNKAENVLECLPIILNWDFNYRIGVVSKVIITDDCRLIMDILVRESEALEHMADNKFDAVLAWSQDPITTNIKYIALGIIRIYG